MKLSITIIPNNTVNDGDEFVHPKLSIHKEEESKDEESFDPIVQTPENSDDEGNDDASIGLNVTSEEAHDVEDDDDELYRDVNINLEGRDVQMTDVHTTQEFKDTHVTLTLVNPDGQQQSLSMSSQFVTTMLNPSPDFVGAVSFILGIFQRYMDQRMNESVKVAVQIQSDILRDEAQAKNEEFLKNLDENIPKIIKEQVKEQVKILIEKMESNKSIHRSDKQWNLYKALVKAYESDKIILDTYGDIVTLKRRRDDADKDEEPSVGSDRGSKRRREEKEPESTSAPKEKATKTTDKSTQGSKSHQKTASESIPAEEPMHTTQDLEETSHQEFETCAADDQPIVEASHDLAKQLNSRSSFNELMDTPVDFLEFLMNRLKVYTLILELLAGPTYELMKGSCKSLVELEFFLEDTLPLIPNSRGRHVILFDHFINNDLEYLRGGASSLKYTTFVAKTKAADYGHIKWIEDLVPRTIIIADTELQIVEWHNYKHLDWITVRRDDDKLYKFKEGDFKRLCIQDIQDMLLLLRVEDLQLGVESYQKKLNLTKLDTYRSNLKRKEAYTAYNPRGFIYQNKEKQNRLIRIDELHKFCDGMLNDVRIALDDRLKSIRMKYLPQAIWRKSDKERAAAMIQAIDKQLKMRRIMRSLEKFVGGILYEGDFRMLQRTI
uniref:Uncharacterized protein n=1 Tax=Tanacetum cinerariifolium TaxID=118510 RepID=A0A6L2JRT4_TANCI|nr:hypothetical protein [Tanacetum cinerariifolium]